MSHEQVTAAYDKPMGLFDREYVPRLARLDPGVEMDQLTAERDERKVNFERSYTEFGDSPTGYDLTPLKTEYTYGNQEGIQKLNKDGRTRYFFYIQNRLWKIYDEVPLESRGPLGDSFRSAVIKLGRLLGGQGRVQLGDPARGLDRTTADWHDASTHLRVVDRSGEQLVAVVLEDKRTLENLAALRPYAQKDPFALDPSVTSVTGRGVSDPDAVRTRSKQARGPASGRR